VTISVNGVAVAVDDGATAAFAATRELLRQQAVALALLEESETDRKTINDALENLLAREVAVPVPTEAECRRYYEQHPSEFESGDLIHARHILFQVTPRVDVAEIRAHAESTLNTLLREPARFAELAAELSNCPSGQHGGNLGQIGRGDTVPEFEQALFRLGPTGLLRDLVKTRYGFHIVAVDQRIPGAKLPFEQVREQIAGQLQTTVEETALHQYVRILAGKADIQGVDLSGVAIPLVQ
jgi:peptidyl-prolyl cis-trans isomerase C